MSLYSCMKSWNTCKFKRTKSLKNRFSPAIGEGGNTLSHSKTHPNSPLQILSHPIPPDDLWSACWGAKFFAQPPLVLISSSFSWHFEESNSWNSICKTIFSTLSLIVFFITLNIFYTFQFQKTCQKRVKKMEKTTQYIDTFPCFENYNVTSARAQRERIFNSSLAKSSTQVCYCKNDKRATTTCKGIPVCRVHHTKTKNINNKQVFQNTQLHNWLWISAQMKLNKLFGGWNDTA